MKLVNPDLEQTYATVKEKDKRQAAEIAYALGLICKKAGDYKGMKKYREESIMLFKEVGVDSLDAAYPIYESINEIMMPDLIHEGVVERDLVQPRSVRSSSKQQPSRHVVRKKKAR